MIKTILVLLILLIGLFTNSVLAQPTQTVKPKTRQDLIQQINTAKQEKNLIVQSNNQFTRIMATRMVLGTQNLLSNDTDETNSGGTSITGTRVNATTGGAKIPTWELIPYFGFPTDKLTGNVSDFLLMFYVYDAKFQKDSDLVLNVDGQEMTFQAIEKGQQLNSDYKVAEGVNGMDQNTDDQRSNISNYSQNAKPYYSTFRILRADMEKITKAEKVKITLSKKYQVNLRKEYKATLQTMFDLATLK